MGKRLSQLNEVEQVSSADYLLVDGEEYLESKKILIKNINIKNFNTEDLDRDLAGKQEVLIDGKNIKTINGESILGEGEIKIQGGTIDPEVLNGKQDKFAEVTLENEILILTSQKELRIKNLVDPIFDNDAVNKRYLDTIIEEKFSEFVNVAEVGR